EFLQLRKSCRQGERIPGKCSRLINWSIGRKLIHDFRGATERAHRQTAANDFAERSQIRPNSIKLLCAASRDAETGHNFIENQESAVSGAFFLKLMKEIFARKK